MTISSFERVEKKRGGSRGTSNNSIGEQNSNYFMRKTKLKGIFALVHRCSMHLKPAWSKKLFIF